MRRVIFVFGSNKSGIHGAGAALCALEKHGAIKGKGWGLQGDSYAIPTKDFGLKRLLRLEIGVHVDDFLMFTVARPDWIFQTTRIGCGRAGFKDEEIAPMFNGAPVNVILPEEWKPWLAHYQPTIKWEIDPRYV
jgi:hypothetical protein